MGSIISNVDDLASIRWDSPKKGRVHEGCTVMFVHSGCVVIRLPNQNYVAVSGRESPNGKYASLNFGLDDASRTVLNGLVRMRVLTRQQINDHLKSVNAREALNNQRHQLDRLVSACEALEIPLPEDAAKLRQTLDERNPRKHMSKSHGASK